MNLKKNPKYDLEHKRSYFTQIGLIISLLLVIVAFEWRTYDRVASSLGTLDMLDLEEEIIPLTEKELKPPPPPPPPPPKITIVEDDIVIEEELDIEDAETDEEEIIEILEEEEEEELFNFAVVEQQPIFPGCSQNASKDENYICFQKGIGKHIKENFEYPQIAKEMGISEKIFVEFVISKSGSISSARVVRGQDKYLREEALRLVNAIPTMIPAKQRGKSVSVTFTLPINFSLQ
jgi:protein TonB